MAPDMSAAGGTPLLGRRLMEAGLITDTPTVTGKSLFEHFAGAEETPGQEVIVTGASPIKARGGFGICYGNIAPEGCVVKLAGHGKLRFEGPAKVYDGEEAAFDAVTHGAIQPGDTIVVPMDTERLPRLPFWQSITSIIYNLAVAVAAVNSF